jgi:hypothetical protein
MTKKQAEAQQAEMAPEAPVEIALDEFCRRLSEKERRFALISGFQINAQLGGMSFATETDFQAAFRAFIDKQA